MHADTFTVAPTTELAVANRASDVRLQLSKLKDGLEDGFFDMCDLLLETLEKEYHIQWGYGNFKDWVEMGSGLDMSARQALYYTNISKKAKLLGATRDELKKAKISKLKEIFRLDPEQFAEEMKELVVDAAADTLEEIKERVGKLKAVDGQEPQMYMTIKVDASIKETIQSAFELARMNYGDVVVNGEIVEPSDTKCLELIAVSYIQDPNNTPEAVHKG